MQRPKLIPPLDKSAPWLPSKEGRLQAGWVLVGVGGRGAGAPGGGVASGNTAFGEQAHDFM